MPRPNLGEVASDYRTIGKSHTPSLGDPKLAFSFAAIALGYFFLENASAANLDTRRHPMLW
jgi:hypothetical protein